MIHEFRIYDFAPGAAAAYLQFFSAQALPVITKHLPLVGYWMTESGPLNRLVHAWSYQSLADRAQRRAALMADRQWTEGILPKGLPMIRQQTSVFTEVISLPEPIAKRDQESFMHRQALAQTDPTLVDRYYWWKQLAANDVQAAGSAAPYRARIISGEATGGVITLSAPMSAATLTDQAAHATLLRSAVISAL